MSAGARDGKHTVGGKECDGERARAGPGRKWQSEPWVDREAIPWMWADWRTKGTPSAGLLLASLLVGGYGLATGGGPPEGPREWP